MRRKGCSETFDRIVAQAIERIPGEVRQQLENIVISVQERPSKEMLEEMGIAPDESLLGIYCGAPLNERSLTEPPLYPDTIFLFQRPLEEMCSTKEELMEEIEITIVHEIAHALGMTEEEIEALGYG